MATTIFGIPVEEAVLLRGMRCSKSYNPVCTQQGTDGKEIIFSHVVSKDYGKFTLKDLHACIDDDLDNVRCTEVRPVEQKTITYKE